MVDVGIIRLIARKQATYDLKGLVKYLEENEDLNIKSYGYLGAAEALVPEALGRAESNGFQYPNGLLDKLWNERPFKNINFQAE